MSPKRDYRPRSKVRERTARALECIRRLVNALGESARAVEQRTGLTNAQLFLLRQLDAHAELTINELAELALTQQSTVSLLVRRLEEAGYVQRARSPLDRRRVCAVLTLAGRAVVRRAPSPPLARMIDALGRLRAADVEALTRGMTALLRQMHVSPASAPLFESPSRGQKRRVREERNRVR